MKKLGIIIGSLRKESFNRKVAEYLGDHLKDRFEVEFIDLAPLSMYNQDLDGTPPQAWLDFRKQVEQSEAFLFVSPEYNRSMPAVLKNALDIASRPDRQNMWAKKPALLVTASPGKMGGVSSSLQLKQTMSFLEMYLMPQPELYLGEIHLALDESGKLTNERTTSFLNKAGDAFVEWTNKF